MTEFEKMRQAGYASVTFDSKGNIIKDEVVNMASLRETSKLIREKFGISDDICASYNKDGLTQCINCLEDFPSSNANIIHVEHGVLCSDKCESEYKVKLDNTIADVAEAIEQVITDHLRSVK